jgi:hypothetical protein
MAQTSTKRNAAHFPLARLNVSLNALTHVKLSHHVLPTMTDNQNLLPG